MMVDLVEEEQKVSTTDDHNVVIVEQEEQADKQGFRLAKVGMSFIQKTSYFFGNSN